MADLTRGGYAAAGPSLDGADGNVLLGGGAGFWGVVVGFDAVVYELELVGTFGGDERKRNNLVGSDGNQKAA